MAKNYYITENKLMKTERPFSGLYIYPKSKIFCPLGPTIVALQVAAARENSQSTENAENILFLANTLQNC